MEVGWSCDVEMVSFEEIVDLVAIPKEEVDNYEGKKKNTNDEEANKRVVKCLEGGIRFYDDEDNWISSEDEEDGNIVVIVFVKIEAVSWISQEGELMAVTRTICKKQVKALRLSEIYVTRSFQTKMEYLLIRQDLRLSLFKYKDPMRKIIGLDAAGTRGKTKQQREDTKKRLEALELWEDEMAVVKIKKMKDMFARQKGVSFLIL